jgi:hypothetical protein
MNFEICCLAAYLIGRRDELSRVEQMLLQAEQAEKALANELTRKPPVCAESASSAQCTAAPSSKPPSRSEQGHRRRRVATIVAA